MTAPLRVVVAGSAGGVGTTTVTALLFSALSRSTSPMLVDHTGGDLGARLTGGDDAAQVDPGLALHDLGPHALRLPEQLEQQGVFAVVVVPASASGIAAARGILSGIRDRLGATGVRRSFVVAVGVFGRHRLTREVESLQNEFGRGIVAVVPQDRALAAGGRVPANRISHASRAAQVQLAETLEQRMRGHGRDTRTHSA